MSTRRDFIKKAALLSGGTAFINSLPYVIQEALAIDPAVGSTFYDAEHIVFLMQENRSFDHVFGSLQGVRGFNDPRAIRLSNKNKVWLQSNKEGDTYVPFHLNIKNTKVPWMGSLPHNWTDQTDARNDGKYDKWLDVKRSSQKEYADMPLTLGYCNRADFPFYYSLADAFTVCDHNFCSSITGTHSNRHYWMSGTVREKNNADAIAHLWNVTNKATPELKWKTFPERLEENGISWKVYQNELSMANGMTEDESAWLSNFGCNVLEYFKQYNVRLSPETIAMMKIKKDNILKEIAKLEQQGNTDAMKTRLAAAKKVLATIESDQQKYTLGKLRSLSKYEQSLNSKGLSTNSTDPLFHELTTLQYKDNGTEQMLTVPKSDILHQFRDDVKNGELPTVSWLMPPANFSDHPSLPWFGPWYVSEVMEILLQNPEVWKKTIFIINYDENDGYFDHMAPFVVPNPYKENTGKVSKGIDPKMDFATKDQQTNPSANASRIRENAIGLGYRVPLIVASPWTRGGYVNSEVFDHTSALQFLEVFLEKKFNKKIKDENITEWRRTISGDLTSVFRPYNGEKITPPELIDRNSFIESIHQSRLKHLPDNFKKLSASEILQINNDHLQSPHFPKQEKGVRASCALPYELYVNGTFNKDKNNFGLNFKASNTIFGATSAGSPFSVYAANTYKDEALRVWNYSAAAGDTLSDEWNISDFQNNNYHFRVYGPNGFYREFIGTDKNPNITIECSYEAQGARSRQDPGLVLKITNNDNKPYSLELTDNSYKTGDYTKNVPAKSTEKVVLNLGKSFNWYDVSVKVKGFDSYEERFAGRVETGLETKTDPLMGNVV